MALNCIPWAQRSVTSSERWMDNEELTRRPLELTRIVLRKHPEFTNARMICDRLFGLSEMIAIAENDYHHYVITAGQATTGSAAYRYQLSVAMLKLIQDPTTIAYRELCRQNQVFMLKLYKSWRPSLCYRRYEARLFELSRELDAQLLKVNIVRQQLE